MPTLQLLKAEGSQQGFFTPRYSYASSWLAN